MRVDARRWTIAAGARCGPRGLAGAGAMRAARPANAAGRRGARPSASSSIQSFVVASACFTGHGAVDVVVAMSGYFFAMPQYFQEVRGVDAMGSGLRLLPMIGGMVIGMIGGTGLASPWEVADGMALRRWPTRRRWSRRVSRSWPNARVRATTTVPAAWAPCALASAAFGPASGPANAANDETRRDPPRLLSGSGLGVGPTSATREVAPRSGQSLSLARAGLGLHRSHLVVTGLPAAAAAAAVVARLAGRGRACAGLGGAGPLGATRSAARPGRESWVCGGIAPASLAILVLCSAAPGSWVLGRGRGPTRSPPAKTPGPGRIGSTTGCKAVCASGRRPGCVSFHQVGTRSAVPRADRPGHHRGAIAGGRGVTEHVLGGSRPGRHGPAGRHGHRTIEALSGSLSLGPLSVSARPS